MAITEKRLISFVIWCYKKLMINFKGKKMIFFGDVIRNDKVEKMEESMEGLQRL